MIRVLLPNQRRHIINFNFGVRYSTSNNIRSRPKSKCFNDVTVFNKVIRFKPLDDIIVFKPFNQVIGSRNFNLRPFNKLVAFKTFNEAIAFKPFDEVVGARNYSTNCKVKYRDIHKKMNEYCSKYGIDFECCGCFVDCKITESRKSKKAIINRVNNNGDKNIENSSFLNFLNYLAFFLVITLCVRISNNDSSWSETVTVLIIVILIYIILISSLF